MRYAVILAGGAGKRLWPLSRLGRPKQLLPLLNGKSLLDLAVERLKGVFDNANILIITNREYKSQIEKALPQIPPQNIVGEPEGRDTAAAIALAAELIVQKDPDGTMAVFTADHVIRPVSCFIEAVQTALRAADEHPQALLTFGVRPSWPNTGLGYIQCSSAVADGLHQVQAFKEKPDHQTARRYVESGHHYWNSGMFVWKISAIRAALKQHLPDSLARLAPVGAAHKEGKDIYPALEAAYPALKRISVDYAVMEKAAGVLMAELACEWLDVGSWPSLETVGDLDEAGNVVQATNSMVLDSFRNVIVTEADHLIAVLGMDDCIIVHSADATLVCNKSDSQRLKELVEQLEAKYGRKYL